MKQIKFLMLMAIVAIGITSCFRRPSPVPALPNYISIRTEDPDVYTDPSFQNMMKNPDYKPSVVVRNSVASGDVSSTSNATRIIALMESGLLRNKIDVRDRGLFDRVLNSYSQNNQ